MVCYGLQPIRRKERAARTKIKITTHFDRRQQVFLEFVLSQHMRTGVDELAQEKLSPLLRLKCCDVVAQRLIFPSPSPAFSPTLRFLMFAQAFKPNEDTLWKDAGCPSEPGKGNFLLLLKYLDALEHGRAAGAKLESREYPIIFDAFYGREAWAVPNDFTGNLDHQRVLAGDNLRDFTNLWLFPYLHIFKAEATGPNTIEHKIGQIFGEIRNKTQRGYNSSRIGTPTAANGESRGGDVYRADIAPYAVRNGCRRYSFDGIQLLAFRPRQIAMTNFTL